MNQNQINAYIRKHGIPLKNGQVMLTKPLYVFKKVYSRTKSGYLASAIANLVIPIGAVVNLSSGVSKKLRANQAYCHSIVEQNTRKQSDKAISGYNSSFVYNSSRKLGLPNNIFDNLVIDAEKYQEYHHVAGLKKCKIIPDTFNYQSTSVCSHGIHFFVELSSAKNY